ncbi:ADP-ribosylation factor-like protein 6-interacting protein 6 [Lates japonicus]|uniref:ADP-ribosylation factor-like protein 6-interacting protein 6 n=1 Tax=Lates japonicus TaxID=270547 RepID=A0AAD3MZL5_LATJO|nr:ADP-ribosylation factor-like protein 6-interacting protein 6 [Lates japonicus]
MPRSATDWDIVRESFGRSHSPEDMEHPETYSAKPSVSVMSGEGLGGSVGRPFASRNGPKRWSVVVLSVLGSAVAAAAVGCFCAFVYPILKELRAGRVRGEDGTEERILEDTKNIQKLTLQKPRVECHVKEGLGGVWDMFAVGMVPKRWSSSYCRTGLRCGLRPLLVVSALSSTRYSR